ncbi:MAG: OmpA family protein [Cyclobacteriaceae bacterium]|nr:OmpA family protein [Cyclobacteriaceae bacterium]
MSVTAHCLWLLFPLIATAQNLVPNPGFEELIRCPHSFSKTKDDFIIPGWTSPTKGTPDVFHACSWGEADVPYNWAGSSSAKEGKGYVGIYAWMNTGTNYREYIQCELAEPLQAGARYHIGFHFKLATNSVYTINRMGLLLTQDQIRFNHDRVIERIPTLSVQKDSALDKSTGSWEKASLEYVAEGGELFLTIGNFSKDADTRFVKLNHRVGNSTMLASSAYYYLDEVWVVPLDPVSKTLPEQEFISEEIELNRDYVLKNIQFEFNSHTLLKSSFPDLDRIVNILNNNPTFHVRLSGHTDDVGSAEYNLTLSRSRARSVAEYLNSKGIDRERISTFGFGKEKPIVDEKTDEARSVNRRVEMRFTAVRPDDKF